MKEIFVKMSKFFQQITRFVSLLDICVGPLEKVCINFRMLSNFIKFLFFQRHKIDKKNILFDETDAKGKGN